MATKSYRHTHKPPSQTKYYSKKVVHYLTELKTPIRLEGTEKLNKELLNLYHLLLPHKDEIRIREYLTNKMKSFVLSFFPSFKLESFGSSECNMYLPTSDIDILLVNEEKDVIPNKVLTQLSTLLRKDCDFIDPTYIIHISKARVPILKCRDKCFGYEFDIIVNKVDALKQSKYIHEKIIQFPYLRPICIILKYFLKIRNLNDSSTGGLCSYAQFLLVLHFIQLHPLLQQKNLIDPMKNIGALFMDFFQFYGFDYPYEGVTHGIKDFIYKRQSMSNAIISIEDPVNVNHDVGDNCSNMHAIKDVFVHAYRVMAVALGERVDYRSSLMCLWIQVNFSEEMWRKANVEKYKNIEKKENMHKIKD